MRAVIYARFSSDQQHERSIDDQVRLCREHAEKIGASVTPFNRALHAVGPMHQMIDPATRHGAALLDQIATDISRPAPQPLQPLIDLVSTEAIHQ